MPARLQFQTTIQDIDWRELENLFKRANLDGRQAIKLQRAYQNSAAVLFVFDENHLIGTARAISDLEYHAGIYDVAVLPEYQGQGLGRLIMERLLSQLKVWRVMLVCDPDVEGFYRKFGFEKMDGVMAKFDPDNLYDPV
jgi:aralkylamine N-acetyltransferase